MNQSMLQSLHLRAIGMALTQFLTSKHEESSYFRVLEAIRNNNASDLAQLGVHRWLLLETYDHLAFFKLLSNAIESFETHLQIVYTQGACNIPPTRAIIHLEGGIIKKVTSDRPLDYLVYDFDIEGNDPEDSIERPSMDVEGEMVEVYKANVIGSDVNPPRVISGFISAGVNTDAACVDSVDVGVWYSQGYSTPGMLIDKKFSIEVRDQRGSNGKMYVGMPRKNGDAKDVMCAVMHADRLPGSHSDTQSLILCFDYENLAVSFFNDDGRITALLNDDVTMHQFTQPNGQRGFFLELE